MSRGAPAPPWVPVVDKPARTARRRCRPADARQQAVEIGLAPAQRQAAQVVTVERHVVEGVKLHLVVMLARMQGVEASDAEHHGLAVDHELLERFFKRLVQL